MQIEFYTCYIFTFKNAIRSISLPYSILYPITTQSRITQPIRAKDSNGFREAECVLKTWLWLPILVHFRKQQRNIFNILIASSSASASNRLSKSDLCFKGRTFKDIFINQQIPNLSLHNANIIKSRFLKLSKIGRQS